MSEGEQGENRIIPTDPSEAPTLLLRDAPLNDCKLEALETRLSALTLADRNKIEDTVAQYCRLDKGVGRLPQFTCADEFLECLERCLAEKDLKGRDLTLLCAENVRYEVIIENQRGATILGVPLYSNRSMLYGADPPKFQTLGGNSLESLPLYPLPGRDWTWVWETWHVIMLSDVDEDGWIYSGVRFCSRHWKGMGKFGTTVRRRVWVRMAERFADGNEPETEYDSLRASSQDGQPLAELLVNPRKEEKTKYHKSKQEEQSAETEPTSTTSDHYSTANEYSSAGIDSQNARASSSLQTTYNCEHALKRLYRRVLMQPLDRLKSDRIMEFLKIEDLSTLHYIAATTRGCTSDKSAFQLLSPKEYNWPVKLMSCFHFKESKGVFLDRLQSMTEQEIDDPKRRELVNQIRECCQKSLLPEQCPS